MKNILSDLYAAAALVRLLVGTRETRFLLTPIEVTVSHKGYISLPHWWEHIYRLVLLARELKWLHREC